MSKNRSCINCRHRAIKGASDYCNLSGNFMHYNVIWDKWCPHWSALKTERWEKNLEMLKSSALGDVNSPKTLLRYWKAQAEAGYPQASENVKYYEDMVRRESEDTE